MAGSQRSFPRSFASYLSVAPSSSLSSSEWKRFRVLRLTSFLELGLSFMMSEIHLEPGVKKRGDGLGGLGSSPV